jgi:hypothetical protein
MRLELFVVTDSNVEGSICQNQTVTPQGLPPFLSTVTEYIPDLDLHRSRGLETISKLAHCGEASVYCTVSSPLVALVQHSVATVNLITTASAMRALIISDQ